MQFGHLLKKNRTLNIIKVAVFEGLDWLFAGV